MTNSTATPLNPSTTYQGVFIDVLGLGVLLTGKSGVGKSEIALGLINRGHRLIADDMVMFTRESSNSLIGRSPPILQDFLEVRGLGLLNVRAMFGPTAIQTSKRLKLIVTLKQYTNEQLQELDRLQGMYHKESILGLDVNVVSVPVAPGRNISVLVEGAVRDQLLKLNGYDARVDFEQRQQTHMEKNDPASTHFIQDPRENNDR